MIVLQYNQFKQPSSMNMKIYVCRIEVDEDQLPVDFSEFVSDIEDCVRSKQGCTVEGWQVEEE